MVGTRQGIVCSRTVRRTAKSEVRPEMLTEMKFTPWSLHQPIQEERGGEEEVAERPLLLKPGYKEPGGDATPAARRLRRFLSEQGATPGCKACNEGAHGTEHGAACKRRQREWDENQRAVDGWKPEDGGAAEGGEAKRRLREKTEPEKTPYERGGGLKRKAGKAFCCCVL